MQIKDIINLNFTDNEKFYHVLYLLKLMLDSLITDPNTSVDTLFADSSDTIKADSKKSFIPVTNSILANIATGLYSLCYNGLPSNYTNNEQTNANIFYEMVNECVDLDSKLSTNTSLNPKNILNYFVVYSHCIQGIDTQVLEYWNDILVRSIPESFYATLGSKISNTSIKTDIPVIDIQTDSFELKDMEQYKEFLENQKALQAKNGITIPSAIFNIRANNVTLLSPTQVNDHINPTTVDKYNNIIQHEVVEIPKDIVQITKTIVQDNPVVKPQNIEVKQVPEIEDKRNTMSSNNDLENLSNDYNPQSPSISEDIPEDQTNFDMQYTEPNDNNNLQTMSTLSEDSDLNPESTEQSEPEVSISDDKPIENNFNPELNAGDEINSNDSTQDQNTNFDFNSEPNSEIDNTPVPENSFNNSESESFDFNSEPNSEIDNNTNLESNTESNVNDLNPENNSNTPEPESFEFNSEPNSEVNDTQISENNVNTQDQESTNTGLESNQDTNFNSEPNSEIDNTPVPENNFNNSETESFDFNSEPNSEIDNTPVPENKIINNSEPESFDFNSEPNSEIDNTPVPENSFNNSESESFDFNSEPNSEIDSNPVNNITPEVNTSPEPESFNSEPNSEIDNSPVPENNFNMPAQDSNESNQENIQTENSKKATRLSRMSRSEQTLLQSLNSQFE